MYMYLYMYPSLTDTSLNIRYLKVGGRDPDTQPLLLVNNDRTIEAVLLKIAQSDLWPLQMDHYVITSSVENKENV